MNCSTQGLTSAIFTLYVQKYRHILSALGLSGRARLNFFPPQPSSPLLSAEPRVDQRPQRREGCYTQHSPPASPGPAGRKAGGHLFSDLACPHHLHPMEKPETHIPWPALSGPPLSCSSVAATGPTASPAFLNFSSDTQRQAPTPIALGS